MVIDRYSIKVERTGPEELRYPRLREAPHITLHRLPVLVGEDTITIRHLLFVTAFLFLPQDQHEVALANHLHHLYHENH